MMLEKEVDKNCRTEYVEVGNGSVEGKEELRGGWDEQQGLVWELWVWTKD